MERVDDVVRRLVPDGLREIAEPLIPARGNPHRAVVSSGSKTGRSLPRSC